jgi:L-asparagine transporter-like permease
MTHLTDWSNFYVIVGSSAGALIGLQFVVLTLIAQRARQGVAEAGAAFSTPSVVHFAVVLLLSAVMSAPWHTVTALAVLWGLVGLGGIVYSVVVTRRLQIQTVYKPVFEDWLFHAVLPLVAYAMLAVSALFALYRERPGLFLVGAATLIFLFVGIHNAWDATTWHVFHKAKEKLEKDR